MTGQEESEQASQSSVAQPDPLVETLQAVAGSDFAESVSRCGDREVIVTRAKAKAVLRALKEVPELDFAMLLAVTAVDWMDNREDRFEVVYQLLSISRSVKLRVKVNVAEDKPEVDSVVDLWASANFMEREAFDMLGIKFLGHPDLRRILLYDEFVGHPLRKDYPVQAKQPRIPLRAPEVHNTARDMRRPSLVQIRPKGRSDAREGSGQSGSVIPR